MNSHECIVLYFDIFGFIKVLKDFGSDKLVMKLLNIWNWIIINIKIDNSDIEIKPFLFSDCGFVIYRIKSCGIKETILYKCISDTQYIVNRFFDEEFFIRGAISYGNVTYTDNLIVGDVIVEVVRLEKTCHVPLIILPSYVTEKLLGAGKIIDILGSTKAIDLKDQKTIECNIIYPKRDDFLMKINEYSSYFRKHGPFEYGKVWGSIYNYVKSIT